MTTKSVLEQLQSKRNENILKASSWARADIEEMLQTYNQAKEIALEMSDTESLSILNEKISQMSEAIIAQSKTSGIQI